LVLTLWGCVMSLVLTLWGSLLLQIDKYQFIIVNVIILLLSK
jgi:hypothetical protein